MVVPDFDMLLCYIIILIIAFQCLESCVCTVQLLVKQLVIFVFDAEGCDVCRVVVPFAVTLLDVRLAHIGRQELYPL